MTPRTFLADPSGSATRIWLVLMVTGAGLSLPITDGVAQEVEAMARDLSARLSAIEIRTAF